MKCLKATVVLLFIIISFSLSSQCINGVKSYPLYSDGAEYVKYLDSVGMEIVRIEYDLIFSTKESFRDLYADWEYLFVGFVDAGVKDFNLILNEYDAENDLWFPVAYSDEAENGLTTMIYQPIETKMYKIVISIEELYEDYSAARYGLIYVHD
jgi:hypothetical protein